MLMVMGLKSSPMPLTLAKAAGLVGHYMNFSGELRHCLSLYVHCGFQFYCSAAVFLLLPFFSVAHHLCVQCNYELHVPTGRSTEAESLLVFKLFT